jgi:hypothetical protein
MSGVNQKIFGALSSEINTAATGITVIDENESKAAPDNALYLILTLMPGIPVHEGCEKKSIGVFQVSVMALPDAGWGAAYAMADTIEGYFYRNLVMTNSGVSVRVVKTYIMQGYMDTVTMGNTVSATRYRVPVRVEYVSYNQ